MWLALRARRLCEILARSVVVATLAFIPAVSLSDGMTAAHSNLCPARPTPNKFQTPERRLPRREESLVSIINQRASSLAAGYLAAETALRALGYDPNRFPEENRSWAAVIRGESLLGGVYERQGDGLIRLDMFSTEKASDEEAPASALAMLEQGLLHTPLLCGTSLGALDADINDGSKRYIYSFQLVDRNESLAWGIHFRFTVDDDSLNRIEPLHFRCRTIINHQPPLSELREIFGPQIPDDKLRIGEIPEYVPLADLPNESHLLQLKINSVPFDVGFWTPTRYITIQQGFDELPMTYRWARSPCVVTAP